MSHVIISYKGDNNGRRAIIDLIRWFGLRKSKLIFRSVRAAKTFADLDKCDMAMSFGGCSGEPVRRLIAHIHGQNVVDAWVKASDWDPSALSAIKEGVPA